MSAPQCRLLPFTAASGAWNMAADETLLQTAASGAASFRLYGWSPPTLSLGYFQSSAVCRARPNLSELTWVRRPTGGAALVHHLEVTYALAVPTGAVWHKSSEPWLRRMHVILLDALAALGVAGRLCGAHEENKRDDVLCFLHQTCGDVLIGDAKVIGSAQRKQGGALLQHGSILLDASPFAPQLPGIRQSTGVAVEPSDLCAAAIEQLARNTGWKMLPGEWPPLELRRLEACAANKYSQSAWNDKR